MTQKIYGMTSKTADRTARAVRRLEASQQTLAPGRTPRLVQAEGGIPKVHPTPEYLASLTDGDIFYNLDA